MQKNFILDVWRRSEYATAEKQARCKVCKRNSRRATWNVNLYDIWLEMFQWYYLTFKAQLKVRKFINYFCLTLYSPSLCQQSSSVMHFFNLLMSPNEHPNVSWVNLASTTEKIFVHISSHQEPMVTKKTPQNFRKEVFIMQGAKIHW